MALPYPKKKNNFKSLINNDQEGFWLKKAWRQGKKALAKANEPLKSRGLLFEALEPRVLMSADLSYGQTPDAPTDLTLTFDAGSSQYQLVDSSNAIVSFDDAADASDGGVVINGTSGNDFLTLDLTTLTSVSLTFQGAGIDTLKATGAGGDDFSLSDTSLIAGNKTFSLLTNPANTPSFENADLTGGNLDNTFTLNAWSGSVTIDGSQGTDTLDLTSYASPHYRPATADSGSVLLTGTQTLDYAGLELAPDVIRQPLLFIPGFGGTIVADKNDNGSINDELPGWLTTRGMSPDDLQLEILGDSYQDMVKTFLDTGFYSLNGADTNKAPLYVATWDWRMPVAPTDVTIVNGVINGDDGVINGVTGQFADNDTATPLFQSGVDYLGWWLDKASEDWMTRTGDTLQSVDLVTHSTGGLVARAYIQSDAYATGIKVDDLVLAGVPSEGTSSVYNLLHNDFSDKPAARILGRVVNEAWELMQAGTPIAGPDAALTKNNYTNDITGQRKFVKDYVGALSSLLPSYGFLDTDDGNAANYTLPLAGDPYLNTFLLDLNGGANKDGFIDLTGETTVIYGQEVETAIKVQQKEGPEFDEILPFTDYIGRLPATDEIFWQDVKAIKGDGTVPEFSALPDWFNQSNKRLTVKEVTAAEAGEPVGHSELVQYVEGQSRVLDAVHVYGYDSGHISTTLVNSQVESLNVAIDLGLIDPQEMLQDVFVSGGDFLVQMGQWGVDIVDGFADQAIDEINVLLDKFNGFWVGDANTQVFVASVGNDDLVLERKNDDYIHVRENKSVSPRSWEVVDTANVYKVYLGLGNDTLTVLDLDVGADVFTYGGYESDAWFLDGTDTIKFGGNTILAGHNLTAAAETIIVEEDATISTRAPVSIGNQTTPTTLWTSGQTYASVMQDSTTGGGSGMTVSIATNSTGKPTATLINAGTGYAKGDKVSFAPTSGPGSLLTVEVSGAGNIDFKGQTIEVKDNAQLLADVSNVDEPYAADGGITLAVEVKDFSGLSPVDVFPSSDVSITVAAGALIKGGEVSVSAKKTSQTAILPITLVSVQSKSATVSITGATIEGSSVTIDATAADENILEEDAAMFNSYAIQPAFNFFDVATMLGIPPLLQAVSVVTRAADTTVNLTNSHIVSSGDVSITANTTVQSSASAAGGADPGRSGGYKKNPLDFTPYSAGYAKADGSAQVNVTGNNTTIIAGNDVTIESATSTTAEVAASTVLNSAPKSRAGRTLNNANEAFGVSVAITDSITVSKAIVGQGVTITAQGTVNVNATGEVANEANAGVAVFLDGSGSIGVAVGTDKTDIQSMVDGNIFAGAVQSKALDLKLNKVNFATDTIEILDHGLTPGQELLYLAADPNTPDTALKEILGLESGEAYRVIVVDKDHIQLTLGSTIELDASRADPDATQTLSRRELKIFDPATAVNATNNTIAFAQPHGFTDGQVLDYLVGTSDGAAIGGLTSGESYYAITDGATRIKLATADAAAQSLTGETRMIDEVTYYVIDLALTGSTETVLSFDPAGTIDDEPVVDAAADTIILSKAEDLVTGQKVTYSMGGNANDKIGGLNDSTEYYVIRVEGKADRVQLATSEANALAGTAIDLTDGATGTGHSLTAQHIHVLSYDEAPLSFKPSEAVATDGSGNLTFEQNHGLQTGDAVVYRTDPGIRHEIGMTRFANFTPGDTVVEFNPLGVTADGENVIDMTIDPDAGDDIINAIVLGGVHDYVTGQRVTYSSGDGGTAIGGLSNRDYFIIAVADDRIQLANTRADALDGIAIALTGTGSGSDHILTTNPVDLTDDIIVSAGHGYETGQKITYLTDGGAAIGNLTPQNEYYVIRVSDNLLELASSRTNAFSGTAIDLTVGATGTHSLMSDTVVMLFDGGRNVPVVDLTANTIELTGHGFIGGETVTYSNGDGNAIGGLTTGGEYTVVVVNADHIKLATTMENVPGATEENYVANDHVLDLTGGATTGLSQHLLYTADDAKIIQFDPTPIAAVDDANDAIQLTGEHRFKAGERVTYLTGGGTAIGGLVNGHDYFVIPTGDSSFQLADATDPDNLLNGGPKPLSELTVVALSGGATGDRHGFERASTAARGDTAIGGLQDGQIYFVTKVNDTTIRLSDSPLTANAALPVDLEEPVDNNLTLTHTLQAQGEEAGINVIASLESENRSISQTRIGGTPTLADFLTANVAQDPKTAKAIASGGAKFLDVKKAAKFSLSASVAVAAFDHDVLAQVGEHAILESGGNITVNASAEQSVQVSAEGSVTSEALRPGVASQKIGSASIAVAVGTYNTTVQALVAGGAQLDAIGDIAVTSDVSYPLLIDSLPFHQDRFNINDPAEGSVTDELASALNGKLGLNNMMNVWASTKGRVPQGKATITGSIGITSYTNVSEAIIGAGAKINQKTDYKDLSHSVSVDAKTSMELVSIAGIIQLDMRPENLKQLAKTKSSPFSLFGNEAGMLGIGGSVLVQSIENHTIAKIEGSVVVDGVVTANTNVNGELSVTAAEDIWSLDFAQAGGNSGKIGVSGSFSFADHTSETLAQLDSGVRHKGDSVLVDADSVVNYLNLVGAVQLAKEVGIGVSVGSTTVGRSTEAVVGKRRTKTDATIGNNGTTIDADTLTLEASNDGRIMGIGVAAAVVSDIPGLSITPKGNKPSQIGVGIAGVYNENFVTDNTQAYVNDQGKITLVDDLSIDSQDHTSIFSVSGAATLVKPSATAKAAVGLAGAVSINELNMTTEAFLAGADVEGVNNVTLNAERDGDVFALTVGVAVAALMSPTGTAAVSAAGSASVNTIASTTRAFIDSGDIDASNDVSLTAKDTAVIKAVAIGGAGAGGSGKASVALAGAVSLNTISGGVEAYIANSTADTRGPGIKTGGTVTLTATDDTTITADAGGFAIAIGTGGSGGAKVSGSIGASIAINDIGGAVPRNVLANVDNTTIEAGIGDVGLTAISTATINALAIGGALSGTQGSAGFTGALAGAGVAGVNTIRTNVGAKAKDSRITVKNGNLDLDASDTSTITAHSIGASIALAQASGGTGAAVSIGVSLSLNEIDNDVTAAIDSVSLVKVEAGDVLVSAVSESTIKAIAVAAAISASQGMTSVGVSGGGAVSSNQVTGRINAYVAGSNITQVDDVNLDATNTSKVDATIAAVSASLSLGTTTGVGVAIGVSVARNFIGVEVSDSTTFKYATDTGLGQGQTLLTHDKVKIAEGARAGDVYEYLGPDRTQPIADYTTELASGQTTKFQVCQPG